MRYEERQQDLFTMPEDWMFVQCISADFAMGAGIAVQFNRHFNTKAELKRDYGNRLRAWDFSGIRGECLKQGRVYNLVTKRNYWDKPTLDTMRNALCALHGIVVNAGPGVKLAMPLIGCGIDRLRWEDVSRLVQEIFADTDAEIVVCIR